MGPRNSAFELRRLFKPVSVTKNMVAASDPSLAPACTGKAGHTLYIQRIAVHLTTTAAQSLTFQDTAGTPIVLAKLPNSATVGDQHILLDSDEGVPCTEGKSLDMVASAAGLAGSVWIEGYLKQTGTIADSALATGGA